MSVPDAKWGERPVAVVVPRPETRLDYPTLEAHCRARLAAFNLPRNPSAKLLERVLREELKGDVPGNPR